MAKDPVIAVLLPCYNEAQTIAKVVQDFRAALPTADIYVYDNNSTDGTADIASAAGAIVRHEYVQGKGAVVRRMFREIDADVYVMSDGDDTYPADMAPELVRAVLRQNADMAVGDRLSTTYFTENKRLFHNFGNTLVRALLKILFRSDTKDVMTGLRAFSYNFVKTFPVLSNGFEIETEMTAHAADRKLYVVDIPIQYRDRPEGSVSKLNTTRDGARAVLLPDRAGPAPIGRGIFHSCAAGIFPDGAGAEDPDPDHVRILCHRLAAEPYFGTDPGGLERQGPAGFRVAAAAGGAGP